MKSLIILFGLVVAVLGRPEGLGYNYNGGRINNAELVNGGLLDGYIQGYETAELNDRSLHGHHDEPIVSKHFYIHSAPNVPHKTIKKHFKIGHPQVHYRVIFIKSPSHQGHHAEITAEYAPVKEKTAIYLLSQKPGDLSISDIVSPPPTEPSRPEVHIIKYNNPAEAEEAQRQIKAQYDHLGGHSQVTNEGIAPVTSVVSSHGSSSHGSSFDGYSTHIL